MEMLGAPAAAQSRGLYPQLSLRAASRRNRRHIRVLAPLAVGAVLALTFGCELLGSFVVPAWRGGSPGGRPSRVSAQALAPTHPADIAGWDGNGNDDGDDGEGGDDRPDRPDGDGPSPEDLARLRLSRGSNFFAITTEDDLQQLLEQMEQADRRLLVVDYYAPWCRACQKLLKQMHKIAVQEEFGDVAFAAVDFERSRELCKSRNMKKLPTLELYRGNTLQQRWAGASKQRLLDRLEAAMNGESVETDVQTVKKGA